MSNHRLTPARVQSIGQAPVIIGGGIAGLTAALRLAPMPVVVLVKAPLQTEASSAWAQGGIAAAVGEDDSPAQHLADTLAAGGGLCDSDLARAVIAAGPAAIEFLLRLGARFDRTADGALQLGLEAAHSRRRIVHASGDSSGREVMRVLTEAARATSSITLLEGWEARRLLRNDEGIVGVLATSRNDAIVLPTDPRRPGDGWRRRAVPRHDEPTRVVRPGAGAGRSRRCGADRHGVRAIPSDRTRHRQPPADAGQRGGTR